MHVGRMWADEGRGRGRMSMDTGGYHSEVGELDAALVTVASVTLGASERSCARSWRPQASLYSDCAGLQGNGPLRERRSHWVRLVLTPCAIT